jgi:hypothetical protein
MFFEILDIFYFNSSNNLKIVESTVIAWIRRRERRSFAFDILARTHGGKN